MNKTPVEWLEEILTVILYNLDYEEWERIKQVINEARAIEMNEKLKRQLFIGKVSEIIGIDKTTELLKESNELFKK